MVAFAFRPGYGFPGDISRHLFSVEARASDAAIPATGIAVMINPVTGNVRPVVPGDSAATDIWGVVVRAFPMQMGAAPGLFGASPLGVPTAPPHPPQPVDILRMGYIIVPVVGAPAPGGPVFVWVAASGSGHTQGGFEAAATAGSTMAINWPKTTFSSGADGSGYAELAVNI